MKRLHLSLLLCLLLINFTGCATIPKEVDLKESLRVTADSYWKLRMQEKYEETYRLEFSEGPQALTEYIDKAKAIKRFQITSFSIKKVNIEGSKGLVDVEFRVIFPISSKPMPLSIADEWIYKDGVWYHVLK